MKGTSDTKPNTQLKSRGKTQVLYNIKEAVVTDMDGKTRTAWEYDYVEIDGELTRDKIINGIIREKYSESAEFALVNNYLINKDVTEYNAFQDYRVMAKTIADTFQ